MDECRAEWLADIVRRALDEDLGVPPAATGNLTGVPRRGRDVTTEAIFDPDAATTATVVVRERGVVAGLAVIGCTLDEVAHRFSLPKARVEVCAADGDEVQTGTVVARVAGPVQALLMAERTLLNLLCRASGVATATRRWVSALAGSGAQVLDTRKTTPGLRELEKYAVRAGGGTNKRMGLYDVAMIKDNHIAAAGSIEAAVARVRERFPDVAIQVEADTAAQARTAIAAGARFLLLDNMTTSDLAGLVADVRRGEVDTGKIELEATGNLTLSRAAEVAATGVDYLSVGALTHSSPILDIALDMDGDQ